MRGGGFGVPGRNGGDFPPQGKWVGRRTAASGAWLPPGGIVHAGCAPHFLFETSKRKCAAPGGKEKMFGGSVCAGADLLPPAGDGWQSLAAVRDGNARPLGRPPARGSQGYPQRLSPLPLTLLRRTASGSENRRWSMRQPPRRRRYHPPRDGSIDLVEESSVPEGQAKSALAPIRRPPCARRATAPERAKRFSLWTVHGPFLFWHDKREMGGASPLDKPPLREQNPRGRRPAAPPRLCSSPTTALIRQVRI